MQAKVRVVQVVVGFGVAVAARGEAVGQIHVPAGVGDLGRRAQQIPGIGAVDDQHGTGNRRVAAEAGVARQRDVEVRAPAVGDLQFTASEDRLVAQLGFVGGRAGEVIAAASSVVVEQLAAIDGIAGVGATDRLDEAARVGEEVVGVGRGTARHTQG